MKRANIIMLLLAALMLSSCMTTRTSINNYKETVGQEYRYAKGKQCYLFWGLIPIGRTTVATPVEDPCQVRTSFRFIDALCTTLTGGFSRCRLLRLWQSIVQKIKTISKLAT